jgi:thiol-disulfide isomerase/thioredoxin
MPFLSVERARFVPVMLFVIVAFGLLFFSIRSSKIADAGAGGLTLLPAGQVQIAPDWTLPNAATGRAVRLSDQVKNGPVVFSFWATWCGPCREELPHLQRVSQKYAGRVQFYGINSNDSRPAMKAFGAQMGLTFPLLSDDRRDAATRYGVDAIPVLVVVDATRRVRAVSVGYDSGQDLEASLSKVLDAILAR